MHYDVIANVFCENMLEKLENLVPATLGKLLKSEKVVNELSGFKKIKNRY